MMSTIFLCLTIGVLIPLFVRSNDPPPLPHTGKLSKGTLTNYILIIIQEYGGYNNMYGGYNNMSYPNNSMIPGKYFFRDDPNNDGLNDALFKVLEMSLILEYGIILMVVKSLQ